MNNYQSNTLLTTQQSTQLQIFISARGLYDMDIFSKSDPYVKVYYKKLQNMPWAFLGRTETIDNNLNPNFKKSFIVDFIFEAKQALKFEVMDEDDKMQSKNDDFIGVVETTVGACAGSREQTSILNLTNNNIKGDKAFGKLIIRAQPINNNNNVLRMKWRASKLMNTDSWFDWWDKSDPYLKFLKIRNDNSLIEAFRTPIIMNDLNPNWPLLQIPIGKLIRQNSPDERFKVQCWDWEEESQAKHQFIGESYFMLPGLLKEKLPLERILSNPKKSNVGTIILQKLQIYQKPTFIDYLRGGLQLNLSVAIDFTGSNGVVTHPTSLHYMNQYQPNQYQQAIMAIASIMLCYDYDKRIPAFGFGAKLKFPQMSTNIVSHCFPLSGQHNEIEAFGLEGLMAMYGNALTKVQLSGPTYFAPIIKQFIDIAYQNEKQGEYCYQVLLILTDGAIHDMDQTINLLVQYCNLPLSIIIVGVGNADFSNMDTLDGDNGLYNKNGVKAARDIVQFVPFNQVQMNSQLLAKQLLAQLPDQVVQYMLMRGRVPNPPPIVNIENMMMENNNQSIEENLKKNLPHLFAGIIGEQTNK